MFVFVFCIVMLIARRELSDVCRKKIVFERTFHFVPFDSIFFRKLILLCALFQMKNNRNQKKNSDKTNVDVSDTFDIGLRVL